MRRLLPIIAAIAVLAGCGSARRAVLAFEVAWPHADTEWDTSVVVPTGRAIAVELGGVRLREGAWTCLNDSTAALYRVHGPEVTVGLDDDAQERCAAEPNLHVRVVGGYAPAGGYVGEWSPAAVTYTG